MPPSRAVLGKCTLTYQLQLVKDVTAWRNAWAAILKSQHAVRKAFTTLYQPIEPTGVTGERRHHDQPTPANYTNKCLALQKETSECAGDLIQDLEEVTQKLLAPVEDVKQRTKLLHKTLKHRENMKLDYERYLSRVEHARNKNSRSAKDEQTLASQEANLAQSKIDYQTADEHVRINFPPLTSAVVALVPVLLERQIALQTTLVGQLYTVLDAYTRQYGFPNPAPPDAEIVRVWDAEWNPLRRELESGIGLVAKGKAVHMALGVPAEKAKGSYTGLGIRDKVMPSRPATKPAGLPSGTGSTTSQLAIAQAETHGEEEEVAPPKPPRPGAMTSNSSRSIPSATGNGYRRPSAPYDNNPTVLPPSYPTTPSGYPEVDTPPSRYQTPANGSSPLVTPSASLVQIPSNTSDYFANAQRRPSNQSQLSIASSAAVIGAAKKKPPPPVPAKRLPSFQSQFVTAMYDFPGQGEGDLSFREGDRIRVVKKTESVDDWWEGELAGVVGSFPANYVKL